ncbi:MAG: HD domain-containing protein, partial [Candidatus Nanohaloarchaea archaeon]|nr:HD domain-containing protein [Candidatus Nanohaloarchaea archaeon]
PQEYSKGYYFVLGLADRTGELELKYWGGDRKAAVKKVYEQIEEGDVIHVKGEVSTYRNREEIELDEEKGYIKKAEEYDIEDFVPKVDKDLEDLVEKFKEEVKEMEDEGYRRVMESIIEDKELFEKLKKAPAAMYYHHAYIGGLLEHILSLIEIVKNIKKIHPELDLDLMKAGCVLHDIGKVEEFDVTTNLKQSEKGLLRGHISIGEEILSRKLDGLEVDEIKENKLHHIVISHHGDKEFGAAKTPSFPEAAAVHHADQLDTQVFQHIDIRENADTDDFHKYDKRFDQIYLK